MLKKNVITTKGKNLFEKMKINSEKTNNNNNNQQLWNNNNIKIVIQLNGGRIEMKIRKKLF